jgi:hypothetical protein
MNCAPPVTELENTEEPVILDVRLAIQGMNLMKPLLDATSVLQTNILPTTQDNAQHAMQGSI